MYNCMYFDVCACGSVWLRCLVAVADCGVCGLRGKYKWLRYEMAH